MASTRQRAVYPGAGAREWSAATAGGAGALDLEALHDVGGPYDSVAVQTVERLLSLLVLVAIVPSLVTIAVAILLAGRNPVFRQARVGRHERIFMILKFRTIPEHGWAAAETEARGVERWRLGLFRFVSELLRYTGLDELPQLWNVVVGDMWLIGPRPVTPEDYARMPPHRWARCIVPPGITGLAQVSKGPCLSPTTRLDLDLEYLANRDRADLYGYIVRRSIKRLIGLGHVGAEAYLASVRRFD